MVESYIGKINHGFEIIEEHRFKESCIVIGFRKSDENYVCWFANESGDFECGYYVDNYNKAYQKMEERIEWFK